MTQQQIEQIIHYRAYPGNPLVVQLKETHISWVILTADFVYKLKKPLQFSFLDFSTLEKRKHACEQEVLLNQRLAKDTYLGTVPVRVFQNLPFIDAPKGEIIDYAVKMRRLDNTKEMDRMLEAGQVKKEHLFQLAEQLADFHIQHQCLTPIPNIESIYTDFADIEKVIGTIETHLGQDATALIRESLLFSKQFLQHYAKDIYERHRMGLTVDGHGDLHTGNIFLLDPPVIFDCIEFNGHYRQMDVLNELAFLCMDLDFYGYPELGKYFIDRYNNKYPAIINDADGRLFLFYKWYRANVRMKVNALQIEQTKDHSILEKPKQLMKKYFQLFRQYFHQLKQNDLKPTNLANRDSQPQRRKNTGVHSYI